MSGADPLPSAQLADLEPLRTDYELAQEAALASDQQVCNLPDLLATAQGERPTQSASDVAKLVAATLATNERVHQRLARARRALDLATFRAERGS